MAGENISTFISLPSSSGHWHKARHELGTGDRTSHIISVSKDSERGQIVTDDGSQTNDCGGFILAAVALQL